MSASFSRTAAAIVLGVVLPGAASAQLIPIKTLPIAQGDQFAIFPSANDAMGGVSIAIRDSVHDPFVNPAKGARVRALRFFGSPSVYNISKSGGSGETLPVGGLVSNGNLFGGAVLAVQELDPGQLRPDQIPVGVQFIGAPNTTPFPAAQQTRAQSNRYAFAALGRQMGNGLSVAGSVLYANLRRIDGVDELYAGSQSVAQHGGDVDARLGVVRDWESGASMEALLVHDRLAMTHDVTFAELFYDPNLRTTASRPRNERNFDRTNTWGLQLAWQRPVGDSGWRLGAFATGNLMSHPELPNYQVVDVVRPLPWDPGHSAAYNVGIGMAQHQGPSTFALDLVYEPIVTHTWGEAPIDLQGAGGLTIPAGGKTTENHFVFSNAIVRLGIAQDIILDPGAPPLHLQAGIATHAIRYWLRQVDHVEGTTTRMSQHWLEYTPSWGLSTRVGSVEVRYVGRVTQGTGRPATESFLVSPTVDLAGSDILAAPSGPLNLTRVSVTTHQFSIAVPLP
jgi:hypothetical protein